jgi:hypothetical protein
MKFAMKIFGLSDIFMTYLSDFKLGCLEKRPIDIGFERNYVLVAFNCIEFGNLGIFFAGCEGD